MTTFWSLLKESVIVQSIVTLALVLAIIVLVLTNRPVPDVMVNLTTLVLGYWFGTKVQHAANVATIAKIEAETKRRRV